MDIASALDESVNPKGQCLSQEQRVYRVKVVTAFLRAGVPIAKLKHFKDIMECLTHSSHMSELMPFIHEEENAQIKEGLG